LNDYKYNEVNNPPTPVVVLPGNSPIALTVIRSLGRRNIPVHVVFPKNELNNIFYPIVKSSRFIKAKYYIEGSTPSQRAAELVEIGKKLGEKAVLIPVTDKDMIITSEFRTLLCKYYHLLMPDHEMLEILLKKNRFATMAMEKGLPVPKTFSIFNEEEMIKAADQIRYPCIIKPDWRQENWHSQFGRQKVILSLNKSELINNYSKIKDFSGEILLQETIEGKEDNIFCAFTFLDENSEPLDFYVCRKLRQSPAYYGNTALAETVYAPEVIELTDTICKKLKLIGYISIEYKYDQRDKQYRIIEITPGRINRQTGVAIVGGVDIPYIWYCYLAGIKYVKNNYNTSTKWISELLEVSALPTYLKNKDINLFSWAKSLKNIKGFEIFSKDDLGPILRLLPASISYSMRNLVKKKKNEAVVFSEEFLEEKVS
jgi:D-aspartate ligase